MALDIVRLYVTHLSEFFSLSDMAVAASPSSISVSGATIPSFVPMSCNSLTAAHYLTATLAEMQECVNETIAMDVSGDANSNVKNLLESARWKFEEALSAVWVRGKFAYCRFSVS